MKNWKEYSASRGAFQIFNKVSFKGILSKAIHAQWENRKWQNNFTTRDATWHIRFPVAVTPLAAPQTIKWLLNPYSNHFFLCNAPMLLMKSNFDERWAYVTNLSSWRKAMIVQANWWALIDSSVFALVFNMIWRSGPTRLDGYHCPHMIACICSHADKN